MRDTIILDLITLIKAHYIVVQLDVTEYIILQVNQCSPRSKCIQPDQIS